MTATPAVPEATGWWGRERTGQSVWEAALERTRYAYTRFDHVFVSFSGGKDSTAVLNVALHVAAELDRLPLRVVFFDEECISDLTIEYTRRVAELPDVELEWFCLPVKHRNACSMDEPHWWPWAPEARDRWVWPLPPEAITELDGFPIEPPDARLSIPDTMTHLVSPHARYGTSCALMGIRADESIIRRKAVSNKRPDNFVMPSDNPAYYKVYPVYDWTATDVWTAPATLGWDYNRSYDLLSMHGFSPSQQRIAPPFGEQPARDLDQWAACFPDLWSRMVYRVPGAACGARYSRTELFAYGDAPVKPGGMTWPTFVRTLVEDHTDPAVRRFVAHKCRRIIRNHYSKTTDPIPGKARHPYTGVSWEWVATIALRGDLKDRNEIMQAQPHLNTPAGWAAYREDVEASRANGDIE